MSTIAVTATRNVRPVEPRIHQAFHVIAAQGLVDRVVVGACRGGDCQAAQVAKAEGFSVHTVIPGDRSQLCDHWKVFLAAPDEDTRPAPHTDSYEAMPPEKGSIAYRHRNERMVELSDAGLIAFPDRTEQQAYSGVTMTINIARRVGKPVQSVILHE
jgi:hypothetical protein